jgi:hypothetical protein
LIYHKGLVVTRVTRHLRSIQHSLRVCSRYDYDLTHFAFLRLVSHPSPRHLQLNVDSRRVFTFPE